MLRRRRRFSSSRRCSNTRQSWFLCPFSNSATRRYYVQTRSFTVFFDPQSKPSLSSAHMACPVNCRVVSARCPVNIGIRRMPRFPSQRWCTHKNIVYYRPFPSKSHAPTAALCAPTLVNNTPSIAIVRSTVQSIVIRDVRQALYMRGRAYGHNGLC